MGERAQLHLRRYLLLGALAGLAGVASSFVPFLLQYELKTLDWRLKLRGVLPPHPDIVIVAIDERSIGPGEVALEEVGPRPPHKEAQEGGGEGCGP